jgi:membrane peptidoglycan carboxypeptidase
MFKKRLTYAFHMLFISMLLSLLSACANNISLGQPQPQNGPIQFYDIHNQLICQLHGQNPQLDCLQHKDLSSAYFIDTAVSELASDLHVDVDHLPTTALHVATTLDLSLEQQTYQKARQYIATMSATHNMHNASVVVLDPHSGGIRALVGNTDTSYGGSQANLATQPFNAGSSFKPFIYATAFEQGISPGEVVYDGPFTIAIANSPSYAPVNSDQKFHGHMSYRTALQTELNIPSLKLYVKVGTEAVIKKVKALGMEYQGTPEYSTALGALSISLLDETIAYAAMANGGVYMHPHTIVKVTSLDNHMLYQDSTQGTRALSPEAAFMITDVLSGTASQISNFGICSPLELYSTSHTQCQAGNAGTVRPAAVMAGLDNSWRSALAIGYTPNLVVGSWTGNSNYSPMADVTDVDGAAQIWHETMLLAEGNTPVKAFPAPPADVVKKTINYPSLTTTDWYQVH